MQLPLLGAATSTVSVTVDAEALPLVVAAPVEVVQAKVWGGAAAGAAGAVCLTESRQLQGPTRMPPPVPLLRRVALGRALLPPGQPLPTCRRRPNHAKKHPLHALPPYTPGRSARQTTGRATERNQLEPAGS